MDVLISTWQPWRLTGGASIADRVAQAKTARARLCIKGTDGPGLYGPNTWTMFKVPPYAGKSNDDLELAAKTAGVGVDLWAFLYFKDPAGEARAIGEAIDRWNPLNVYLDVEESTWGGPKKYAANTGPFLRALGAELETRSAAVKIWLQSYRRPDYHQEVAWDKFLSYRRPSGRFVIDGLGPQAYPIGSIAPSIWANDFKLMVAAYQPYLKAAGRLDIAWLPTLPTFDESGWRPSSAGLAAGIDALQSLLADYLVGFNFWRQAFLFKPEYSKILDLINSLGPIEPEPAPIPVYTTDQKVEILWGEAGDHGWDLYP